MKPGFNRCLLPVFLGLLCGMISHGQVLPTIPGYTNSPQNDPAKRKLSKITRLPGINHEGEVVLNTGVKLWGHLSYQPLTNTLLVWQTNNRRTYQADQLRYFSYTDQADNRVHTIKAFVVRLVSGETRTLLLEELVPGAFVSLLQLPLPNGQHGPIIQDLPQPRTATWQTDQPSYVWFDGRLLAPDSFVRTEIDALLTIVPESVQHWAAAYPRPTCLLELAEWLSFFEKELSLVQPKPAATPVSVPVTLY